MAKEKKKRGKFGDYYKGVKTEMKKVVWPTKRSSLIYRSCHRNLRDFRTGLLVDRYRCFSRS